MIAAAYGSVSDIEILWSVIAAVGLSYSLYNLRDALKDYDFIKHHKISNGRRILARHAVYGEGIRAAIQGIFLTVGILAAFVPEAPPVEAITVISILGLIIRWGLILSSVLLTIKSYLGKRSRDIITGR